MFLYGMQVMGDGLAKVSGGKLEPVSYTHLDVYKRQVVVTLSIAGGLKVFDIIYVITNGGPGFDTQAVSYTHLDVYKRQVYPA